MWYPGSPVYVSGECEPGTKAFFLSLAKTHIHLLKSGITSIFNCIINALFISFLPLVPCNLSLEVTEDEPTPVLFNPRLGTTTFCVFPGRFMLQEGHLQFPSPHHPLLSSYSYGVWYPWDSGYLQVFIELWKGSLVRWAWVGAKKLCENRWTTYQAPFLPLTLHCLTLGKAFPCLLFHWLICVMRCVTSRRADDQQI